MIQSNLFEARQARDAGIEKAVTHANEVVPDWSEQAFEKLKEYLKCFPGEFMAETFRAEMALQDFPLPPSARAWGGIIRRAASAGLIERVRLQQVTNKRAHLCYASVWRAAK